MEAVANPITIGRVAEHFWTIGLTRSKPAFASESASSLAVRTYRNGSWLAACVMAGAAAESILLAVAVAKAGDEKKILTIYNGAGGRSRTTKLVAQGVTASVQQTFETALGVLHYWRDDAAHG